MKLSSAIESAEFQFKQILEDFFTLTFDEKLLSSHGIDHHRRVWRNAKDLLNLQTYLKPSSNSDLPSKLIIACYLHDIGMSINAGISHGLHSKDICNLFLKKNHLKETDYLDVLLAIENHDNKEYSTSSDENELLTILSVADDLDAFGFTGVFRYSEIYLTRRINLEDIGNLIIENAGKRFDNFARGFGVCNEFFLKHKKRFDILNHFFNEYNHQVTFYKFGGKPISGYCGVIEIFLHMIINKKEIKDVYNEPEKYSHDKVMYWYFDGLAKELAEDHLK